MGLTIACTVERTVAAGVQRTFDEVVAPDVLPKVLTKRGPIPAVVGTRDQSGPWDQPGSDRTVVMAGGATAHETVTEWVSPRRFAYRVDRFSNVLGRLAHHATGEWDFEGDDSATNVRWTYTFTARNALAALPLRIVVRAWWSGYMSQCLARCAALAESP